MTYDICKNLLTYLSISGYEILSTGSDLLVQFTANSDNPGQGFKANYLFQPDDNSSAGLVSISLRIAAAESEPTGNTLKRGCYQTLSMMQKETTSVENFRRCYPLITPPKI